MKRCNPFTLKNPGKKGQMLEAVAHTSEREQRLGVKTERLVENQPKEKLDS